MVRRLQKACLQNGSSPRRHRFFYADAGNNCVVQKNRIHLIPENRLYDIVVNHIVFLGKLSIPCLFFLRAGLGFPQQPPQRHFRGIFKVWGINHQTLFVSLDILQQMPKAISVKESDRNPGPAAGQSEDIKFAVFLQFALIKRDIFRLT